MDDVSVRVGRYTYKKSTKRGKKKLMTVVNGKTVHFGDANYSHYSDRTGILNTMYNHYDDERRERYLKRAISIRDKHGNLTWMDPSSANYHAIRVLWT